MKREGRVFYLLFILFYLFSHTSCKSFTEPSGVDTEGGVIESDEDMLARDVLMSAVVVVAVVVVVKSWGVPPGPPASDGKSDSEERLRLGARCVCVWVLGCWGLVYCVSDVVCVMFLCM